MYIGVPKEIKNHEYRVAIVPSIVRELNEHGHQMFSFNSSNVSQLHSIEFVIALGDVEDGSNVARQHE